MTTTNCVGCGKSPCESWCGHVRLGKHRVMAGWCSHKCFSPTWRNGQPLQKWMGIETRRLPYKYRDDVAAMFAALPDEPPPYLVADSHLPGPRTRGPFVVDLRDPNSAAKMFNWLVAETPGAPRIPIPGEPLKDHT